VAAAEFLSNIGKFADK
jgi:hypothetical protein